MIKSKVSNVHIISRYVCLLVCILPGYAYSSEWSIESQINLRNTYDTNRSLSPGQTDTISGVSVIPMVSFNRSTPLSSSSVSAEVQATRYSDENIRNNDVQTLTFRHLSKGIRHTLNIKGLLRRDDTLATLNDLEIQDVTDNQEQIVEDNEDPGLVKTKVRRSNIRIDPSWIYKLTETYSVGLSYRNSRRDFTKESGTGLVEFQQDSYGLNLNTVLDEKSTFSYSVGFSSFEPDDSEPSETSVLSLSYKRKLAELSSFTAIGGFRRSETPDQETTGTVFKLSYTANGETYSIKTVLSRQVSGSSVGSLVEKTQISAKFKQKLSRLSRLTLRVNLFESESLENNNALDRRFLSVQPKLSFKATRNFSYDISYRYRKEELELNNISADSNAAFLGITYNFDKLAKRF